MPGLATVYGLDGEIVRFVQSDEQAAIFGPPDQYDTSLSFDPETNSQTIAALTGQIPSILWQNISLIAGVLYYDGEPVAINPPGETYEDREYLRNWWQALNTAMNDVDMARDQLEQAQATWPGLTPAQKQTWLLDHFDEVLAGLALVLRVEWGILRFIRWLVRGFLRMEL